MSQTIRVLVWNEGRHEKSHEAVKRIYPHGMHAVIADALRKENGISAETATLDDQPDHGLTDERLARTDVLTWWGHVAHQEVRDDVVARVHKHVLDGMGLIVLHSGHFSKIFQRLMGTHCTLQWREADEKERLWTILPSHPIAQGIGPAVEIPNSEMYGERFDIPQPDEQVFISWYEGGEVFRSGCCFYRGTGRIFYFSPGHETYPIYYHPDIQRILVNAVRWAALTKRQPNEGCPSSPAREKIQKRAIDTRFMRV